MTATVKQSLTVAAVIRQSRITGLCAVLLMLAGCAARPALRVQQVNVPVPVPCQQTVPVRPVMPTESLNPGVTLDAFAAAAIAEIERREGYEGELRAALTACVGEVTGGAR